LLFQVSSSLYSLKKASAQGRVLIWKISLDMIKERPLVGFGYGNFEHMYNLHQSVYFKNTSATAQEKQNAGYVKMAYNEFLQNTVEGGIPALVLFGGLLISLIMVNPSIITLTENTGPQSGNFIQNNTAIIAYSGIVAFTTMSLVNFTVQAIPAMALAVLYMAILALNERCHFRWKLNMPVKTTFAIVLITGGVFLGYNMVYRAMAHYRNKEAAQLLKLNRANEALEILLPLEPELNNSESYWRNLGNTYYTRKELIKAITAYNKAKLLSSNPELYSKAAFCYLLTSNYPEAEKNYKTAAFIEPRRLVHRVVLMKLYMKIHRFREAAAMAHQILALEPKNPSKKSDSYKQQAKEVISRLGAQVMDTNEIHKSTNKL